MKKSILIICCLFSLREAAAGNLSGIWKQESSSFPISNGDLHFDSFSLGEEEDERNVMVLYHIEGPLSDTTYGRIAEYRFTGRFTGPLAVGHYSSFDVEDISTELTLETDRSVKDANENQLCGISNWVKNVSEIIPPGVECSEGFISNYSPRGIKRFKGEVFVSMELSKLWVPIPLLWLEEEESEAPINPEIFLVR